MHPFRTPETRRLALLFAVVYFAQGMWTLPVQTMTVVLKERGLSSAAVADFFLLSTIPWVIKPLYGLLSDFVPLFGRRRTSYLLVASALGAASAFAVALGTDHGYWRLAWLYTAMGLGLAFVDVLTDALMVEAGQRHGLTGGFQSVQWTAIGVASLVVGVLGGHLAHARSVRSAFVLAGVAPLITLAMVIGFVREAPASTDRAAHREAGRLVRQVAGRRDLWMVAWFIVLVDFNPLFGPAFLYYQTDVLGMDQRFIGTLNAFTAVAGIAGAAAYAPLSRRVALSRLLPLMLAAGAAGTFAYAGYRGPVSAVAIETAYGAIGMLLHLSVMDLAARSCPRGAEGTFFALLMSLSNASTQLSTNAGGRLYDGLGFTPLVLISGALTTLAWLLIPLVRVDRVEATASSEGPDGSRRPLAR